MRWLSIVAIIGALSLVSLGALGAPAIEEATDQSASARSSDGLKSYLARSPLRVITVDPVYEFDLEDYPACPVQIDADGVTTCIRLGDGTVECFGRLAAKPTGSFLDIDTGRGAVCGVRTDGSHHCWTAPGFASTVANPPPLPAPFQQISVGIYHVCAVDVFGQVRCWGTDQDGSVSETPTGFGFVQVAAAADYTCALQSNGSVVCWGNTHENPDWIGPPKESFEHIDADTWSTCGIARNGGLYCWGDDYSPGVHHFAPGGSYRDVDVGVYDACALEPNGTARCWSAASGNQYGASSGVPTDPFADIAVGYHHACGITTRSQIKCWGRNGWGEGTPPRAFLCNPDAPEVVPEYGQYE
jgi:alpha-tubulin suppressor-like RCC1 family protein